jgi:hypothetical protein
LPLDRFAQVLRRKHDYATTFNSPEGKRVLADLMRRCGMLRDPFKAGAADETAKATGRQDIGRHIVKIMGMSERDMVRISELPEGAEDGEIS